MVKNVVAVPMQSVTIRAGEGDLSPEEIEKRKQKVAARDKSDSGVDVTSERQESQAQKEDRERLNKVVFLKKGDKASVAKVTTGIADDAYIEIKSGIQEGDEVISGSYSAISRKLKERSQGRHRQGRIEVGHGSRLCAAGAGKTMSTQNNDLRAPGPVVIDIENITKHYVMGEETVHALRGVTLQIQRNEYLAIMGPSGSGKSTLMNMLGCLDTPSSGRYEFNGKNVSEMDRRRIGRNSQPRDRLRFPDVQSTAALDQFAQCRIAADLRRD